MNNSQPNFSLRSRISQMNLWQESGYLALIIMDSLWLGLAYYLLANPVTSYWMVITISRNWHSNQPLFESLFESSEFKNDSPQNNLPGMARTLPVALPMES